MGTWGAGVAVSAHNAVGTVRGGRVEHGDPAWKWEMGKVRLVQGSVHGVWLWLWCGTYRRLIGTRGVGGGVDPVGACSCDAVGMQRAGVSPSASARGVVSHTLENGWVVCRDRRREGTYGLRQHEHSYDRIWLGTDFPLWQQACPSGGARGEMEGLVEGGGLRQAWGSRRRPAWRWGT